MKSLVFSCIAVVVFALCIHAQLPPPPPPPIAKENALTRVGTISVTYESNIGGFKVAFPREPTIEKKMIDSSFGQTEMVIFSSANAFAAYSVFYLDFPTAMTDKFDLDVRFDAMRDHWVKSMTGRISKDSELFVGRNYGRELVIESNSTTLAGRVIAFGPRLFVLTVETRGRRSTQSEKLAAANLSRAEVFFNSFATTREFKPETERAELPDDMGVSVQDGVFRSSFLDVKLDLPESWVVLDKSSTDEIFELGKDNLSQTDRRLAEQLNTDTARVLAMVSKNDPGTGVFGAIMTLLVERAPYPNFLPKAVAEYYKNSYLDKTEKITIDVSEIEIGKMRFAWIETFDSETKSFTRMYFANRKGVAFEVVLSYSDEKERDMMLRSLNTLQLTEN